MKFEPLKIDMEPEGERLLFNLCQIVKEEFENIKELTDFEEGLTFAQHRLLELSTIKYEYLKNPFYDTASEVQQFEDQDLRDWCSEDSKSIREANRKLIDQLLSQETSEINTRLYYEKVQQIFEERFASFEGTE